MHLSKPEFKLISCTELPVETVYAAWIISRPSQYKFQLGLVKELFETDVPSARMIAELMDRNLISREEVISVFSNVAGMDLPISEFVHFTWGFVNESIAWREQAVRERQWSFWLTSFREFDQSTFVTDGRVDMPASMQENPESEAYKFFEDYMSTVEKAYNKLIELGVTQENARAVIPYCAKHNGAMASNLRSLLKTVGKRNCWIAQIDLWGPVIEGIAVELRAKHSSLGNLVTPPCFGPGSNDFKGCKYDLIMQNRIDGKDPYSPCPIYLNHKGVADEAQYISYVEEHQQTSYAMSAKRHLTVFSNVWNRNPHTGKILDVT